MRAGWFAAWREWSAGPVLFSLQACEQEQFQSGDPKKTRRVYSLSGSWAAVEARTIIPLTAERHRRSCRGNTTEQFKSVWMKFNPHSSPPPICRLIYSQVHSAAVSEEAADNKPGEHESICDVTFDQCSSGLSGCRLVLHIFKWLCGIWLLSGAS